MLAENMLCTMTVKRASVGDSGQRSSLTTVLTEIPCSPAYPDAGGQLQERLRIQTPILLFRSFVESPRDIVLGDTIEITADLGARELITTSYRARGVATYPEAMSAALPGFIEVILEKVASA